MVSYCYAYNPLDANAGPAGEGGQGMRIIKIEKCADCPNCLLGADDIQFTCDEANVEDPTWYINRPIPDWCPLPEEEV